MKSYAIIAATAILIFSGCNKKIEDNKSVQEPLLETTPNVINDTLAPVTECYEFVQKKDTISLSYVRNGNGVNGQLTFDNYEKDSSHGTVKGTFEADTLKLSYSFQAEGTTSERDIYFLKSGNTLLMGTGDMVEKSARQIYINTKAIKYDRTIVLVKTDCQK